MDKNNLFSKVMWFNNRLKFDIDFFDLLQPKRAVSDHPRYKSGQIYSEKCKRFIQYESGKELDFIKQLELSEDVLFYYEQPVKLQYWRGRRKQSYTPDFGIYMKSRYFIIVEIKELTNMCEDRVQLKSEALIDFCSKRGFGLLITDGKYTIDKILKVKINRKLEKEILKALDHSVVRKRQCNVIMRSVGASQPELLKIILKHKLRFKAFPFKLQLAKKTNEIFHQVFVKKKKYDKVVAAKFEMLFK